MTKHHNVLRGSYHNILNEYDNASDGALNRGFGWYAEMRDWCTKLAMKHGTYPERVIGAFAVLSPTIQVDMCKQGIIDLLERGETTYGWQRNRDKALAVLEHGYYEVIRGAKVEAFADAIEKPVTNTEPVIDRHAVAVYMGRTVGDEERAGLQRTRVQRRISNAYKRAAKARRVPVNVMQAVTWESWIERKNANT